MTTVTGLGALIVRSNELTLPHSTGILSLCQAGVMLCQQEGQSVRLAVWAKAKRQVQIA